MFLLRLPSKLSCVSVVFDFNASLNDAAPDCLMPLSVDLMRMEEWIVDSCHLCDCSFYLHIPD